MQVKRNLTPVQRLAFDRLLGGIAVGDVVVLQGSPGAGKTAILKRVHAALGGVLIPVRDFFGQLSGRAPGEIEEAFLAKLDQSVADHGLVVVDDLDLITSWDHADYRALLLDAGLTVVLGDAMGQHKKLVFGTS